MTKNKSICVIKSHIILYLVIKMFIKLNLNLIGIFILIENLYFVF
jgi:hypothetical protein